VVALTGGYRRTPLLQVGADIYCDTALICDVLEHRQSAPSLYPRAAPARSGSVAQWADSTLFWAAMGYSFSPAEQPTCSGTSPGGRQGLRRGPRENARRGHAHARRDATSAYRSYLRRIASMVDANLCDGRATQPGGFSCYHALWFTQRIAPLAGIFDATPSVSAWMDRMASLGQGEPESFDAAAAIAVAAKSTPASVEKEIFQNDHGIALGSKVTITAESFGPEPTRRTGGRHAHALHPAPQRPARRHGARAFPAHRLSSARRESGMTSTREPAR